MSAEKLREAAASMRSRAEAATPGPWMNTHVSLRRGGVGLAVTQHPLDGGKFVMCDPQSDAHVQDAEHIASWHPTVALAVAPFLEWVADARDSLDGIAQAQGYPTGQGSEMFLTAERHALAVANAYLGDAS